MTAKMSKKKYVLLYSLVFAIFALGCFFLFLKKGKSMIWNQDGGPQYYPYLVYMGQWLRDTFARALRGDFTLRMFDFSIGLGNDVGSVVRTHPLEMLSAFVTPAQAQILYSVIILLRLYLAGLAFSYLSQMFRPLSLNTITGSMIYVFCGFSVIYAVRHLIYGTALIMLPLLIAGAERLLRRGRGWLFALAACIGFVSNYYFMYQATIACGVFILLRLWDLKADGQSVKQILLTILRLAAFYLLGMGMAMFALLPVVASLGASARLSSQSRPANLLAYEGWRHYYQWFLNLITPVRSQKTGTPLNYAVTVLPAIALLLGSRFRKHRVLKGAFVVGTICVLSPLCAYVLSGFSVVSNRWIFCYGLVMGLSFTAFADELTQLTKKRAVLVAGFAGLFVVLAIIDYMATRSVYLLFALGELVVCALAIALVNRVGFFRKHGPVVLLLVTFLSCAVNTYLCYSGRFGNKLSEYLDRGQAYDNVMDSEFALFARIGQEEGDAFWRGESDLVTSNKENYSLLLQYAPTSVYNSVLSGPSTYYLMETDNCDLAAIHRIQGLNARAVSDALANVRYYLTTIGGDAHAPYGFVRSERYSTKNNEVFENTKPLAFGYTYDAIARETDLADLNPLEKEQIMLDAAVLSEDDAEALLAGSTLEQAEQPSISVEEVLLPLPETGDNVKRTKDGYKVKKGGGSIRFDRVKKAGCEAIVCFEDFWTDKVSNFATVATENARTEFSMRGPDTIYSLNRKDYYIRLGYDETDGEGVVTLELPERGKYHLGAVKVFYVPMAGFEARIDALGEESLTDVQFDINRVTGRAELTKDGVMAFSIPYSKGWKVYVDGQESKALQVNIGWLGTYLTGGSHEIRLQYTTPGAVPGRWIALLSWVIFAGVCIAGSRLEKKQSERS